MILELASLFVLAAAEGPSVTPEDLWAQRRPHLVGLGAAAGVTINAKSAAAHLRLSGELTFYSRGSDDLVAMVQVGTSFAFARPAGVSDHFQHVALVGFGYRNSHQRFVWGFNLALGVDWYRAAFSDGRPFENRALLYAEGRLQAAFALTPNLRIGLYAGYGSLAFYAFQTQPGSALAGGFMVGPYVDWR